MIPTDIIYAAAKVQSPVLPKEIRANAGSINADDIIAEVCRQTGLTPEELRSKRKQADIIRGREIATLLAREMTSMSYLEIAERVFARVTRSATSTREWYERARRAPESTMDIVFRCAENLMVLGRRRREEALRT